MPEICLDPGALAAAALAGGEAGRALDAHAGDGAADLGLPLQALLEWESQALERGAAVGQHRLLWEGGEALGHLERAVQVLARRDDLVQQTHRQRLLGVDDPAAQNHVHRTAHADDPRQTLRPTVDQRHAPSPLRKPELGGLGPKSQVAPERQLEAAVNEADKLGLIDPESLRAELEEHHGATGAPALRRLLDRHTFALTDSDLERRFLRLVRRAKLPEPNTQRLVNGFRVDFLWPGPRLIVETDGLRYHRTPSQQGKDRIRDQVLVAAGFTVLRFTHAQVTYDPDHVIQTLRAVSNSVSMD